MSTNPKLISGLRSDDSVRIYKAQVAMKKKVPESTVNTQPTPAKGSRAL